MPSTRTNAELQQQKSKLAHSYNELLEEFSVKDLRHVGNYTLGRLIGKGSFGKVYLARHNLTNGSKVVLKSSRKDDANLAREIHHHRQFLHPHIARLYEVIVTENLVWLVLEYCAGDELYNYLLDHGALPVEKVQKIFTQLTGAVAYIHNKSCVHRDLKLENVLLDKNENVKLCDFGFTREYEGKSNHLQTFCGTVCYSAPEMLKGEKYAGEKVDVWSLGIILFALLAGALPFDEDDDQATKEKILKEDPKYPDNMSEDAKALIGKLLSKRPLLRPSLSDILADPFLAEHAPQQQVLLKFAQPAPFSTPLEKITLERMRSAGVDVDQVVENVLSQRCDGLAGWWALLIEKEERKERRRERKRKEKDSEAKFARRLSGASGRLEKIAPTLIEVNEEGQTSAVDDPTRKRGRMKRRSTPQVLISDLPELPEGCAIETPKSDTPVVPFENDRARSVDSTRPPPPPKEHHRRPSTLRLNQPASESLALTSRVQKRRSSRRHQLPLLNQLASLKHWLIESTKRARSPAKPSPATSSHRGTPKDRDVFQTQQGALTTRPKHGSTSDLADGVHPTTGRYITPNSPGSTANAPDSRPSALVLQAPIDIRNHRHRDSLSPSPMTSHSSFRRNHAGLRGRKSTSSSVSSIRSIHHRHTQSKASSLSSNSIDTVHTPTNKSARSPHTSIKVLPATPNANATLPSNIRVVHSSFNKNEAGVFNEGGVRVNHSSDGNFTSSESGPVFARRKKSAFKGPMLNSALFSHSTPGGPGTPRLRIREDSGAERSVGVGRSRSGRSHSRKRGSVVIEEEGEEEVEEVDAFSPVEIRRGESVHSIMVWDEARRSSGSDVARIDGQASEEKDKAVQD